MRVSSRSTRYGTATSCTPPRPRRTPPRAFATSATGRPTRRRRWRHGWRRLRGRPTRSTSRSIDRATGRVEGRQTLMRITPAQRCIEIGNIYWGPRIAGTRVATEAMYLFAVHALDDPRVPALRMEVRRAQRPVAPGRASLRLHLRGRHFRRAVIVRGRTRDTAWYAMIDEEWPALKTAYEQWLAPDNFDADGRQRTRLSELTAAALAR